MLIAKHKKDKDLLEGELDREREDRRKVHRQLEAQLREEQQHKGIMKRQIDEYEAKIKRLIMEFEEESKKHIRELNEVHEQYRGYKTTAMDLEQRYQQSKAEQLKAQKSEKEARRELNRLVAENEE